MKINFLNALLLLFITPINDCDSHNNDSINNDSKNLLEYYKGKHEAIAYYKNEDYAEAYNTLKNLYEIYGTDIAIEDYSYEIYIAAAEKSNQSYSRYDAVKFLIEKNGYNLTVLNSKKRGLDIAFSKSGIAEAEYKLLKEKHRNSINRDLRILVKGIIKRDQKYRRGYKGKDVIQKRDSVDKINERALKNIFEDYGYPGKKLIGNSFIDNEYLRLSPVIRHLSDSMLDNYFFPKMLHFIKYDGTFESGIFSSIFDQKRVSKGLHPKFTYSKYVEKEEIDKNRYNIGLAPLE